MSPEKETPPPEPPVIEPQTAYDYVRRGWVQHVKGDLAESEADFRQALSMEPDSVEALYGLGMALKSLKRGEEAADYFQQVIERINAGAMADDSGRSTMLRHLSRWHIATIDSGIYKGEPKP